MYAVNGQEAEDRKIEPEEECFGWGHSHQVIAISATVQLEMPRSQRARDGR